MKPFVKVRHTIERHTMLAGTRGVVAAVSGGPDSVALLDLLVRWRDAHTDASGEPLRLHVAHLNHKLRGADSDADAEFVRRLAERLSLPVTIECADVRATAETARRGVEETARELRYSFLLRVARATGADRIATGHTMSDQAETFLMRLARGAGTHGLAAMRPVGPAHEFAGQGPVNEERPLLIRPLLAITRDEVEAYCDERGLEYRIDATNLDGEFTRNRVRRDVLPALRAISPRAVQAIARAAEHLAADQDALDGLAKQFLDAARVKAIDEADAAELSSWAPYSVARLREQPTGLRERMLREAIRRVAFGADARGEITAKHVAAVQSLLDEGASGKRARLPGVVVWREYDAIIFTRADEAASDGAALSYVLELSLAYPRVKAGGLTLTLERGLPGDQYSSLLRQARRLKDERGRDWLLAVLDDEALPASLIVRPRPRGARARVAGHQKTIKLKKLMIGHTIPASRRAAWPVVMTADDCYIWSPGLPPAVDFAARGETRTLAIVRALNL